MARPKKPIDLAKLREYSTINPPLTELGAMLGFSRDGFRKRLKAEPELVVEIERAKAAGAFRIRGVNFEQAERGNKDAIDRLWKTALGHTDEIKVITEPEDNLTDKEVDKELDELHDLHKRHKARKLRAVPDQQTG